MQAYNGNAVVVDVCSLVQFLFQLSVFGLGPVDGDQRRFGIGERGYGYALTQHHWGAMPSC